MAANDREPEPRIPLETAAKAANVPASTARYWLRAHKDAATKQGYPLAVLAAVFAANGVAVEPRTLLAARGVRRLRGPSRQHFAAQEVPRTAPTAPVPAEAVAAFAARIEAANAANSGAILAELRAIREAVEAANGREAARLAEAEAALAALAAEVAALAARRRPWWAFWRRGA